MTARKRWRTVAMPQFNEQRHPSQAAVYRWIDTQREHAALGILRTRQIKVEVSEGSGPWQLYERIDLPARSVEEPS